MRGRSGADLGQDLHVAYLRVTVPVTLHEWMRLEAAKAGLSTSSFIRLILVAYKKESDD